MAQEKPSAKKQKYKLKLNSVPKIEELLQIMYDEVDRVMNEIQEQMNRLSTSVRLNDEALESKTKYAKAMNDFIASKDKALGKKMDIAKLMTEVHKCGGNVANAVATGSEVYDWSSIKDALYDQENSAEPERVEYKVSGKIRPQQ